MERDKAVLTLEGLQWQVRLDCKREGQEAIQRVDHPVPHKVNLGRANALKSQVLSCAWFGDEQEPDRGRPTHNLAVSWMRSTNS